MRLVSILLVTLAACGPQTSDDESSGGSSGAGTSTTAPTSSTTTTPTSEPTTGEPNACDGFLSPPQDAFTPVKISIVNRLAEPVWISAVGCGGFPVLRILDGAAKDHYYGGSECSPVRCFEFVGAESCGFGCNDCGEASGVRIGAGDVIDTRWSGALEVPMEMTAECAPGTDCQRECLRPEPAAAGDFEFELTAFRGCTGDGCECGAPEFTHCSVWAPVEFTDPLVASAKISYPGVAEVQIVIE